MKSTYRTFSPHKGSKPTSKKAKEIKPPHGKVTLHVRLDPEIVQVIQDFDPNKSVSLNAQEILTNLVRAYGK